MRYAVSWNGETIGSASLDPEHDAARALLSLGITEPMEMVDEHGRPRMRFRSIEHAAQFCMPEEDRDGLRLKRWTPHATRIATTGRNKVEGRHLGSRRPERVSSASVFEVAP
jgi:hypothetical protein